MIINVSVMVFLAFNKYGNLGHFISQSISLSQTKAFRYFKFIVKSAHDGSDNATMAEISTYIVE